MPTSQNAANRFRWRLLVCAVVAIACFVAAISHYRSHLMWMYISQKEELHSLAPIPDKSMPTSPVASDWVKMQAGSLSFSLPSSFVNENAQSINGALCYYDSDFRITVMPAEDLADVSVLLEIPSELGHDLPHPTLPGLRVACNQVDPHDFSWLMSPNDVRWHTFCVTLSKLMRIGEKGHTESIFREDLDGVVYYWGEKNAFFQWQSTKSLQGGEINFLSFDRPLDPRLVRAVCQSLELMPDGGEDLRD